jgi:hypothetical protein
MARGYRRRAVPRLSGHWVNFCDLRFRYHSRFREGIPVWFGADHRSINQINRAHRGRAHASYDDENDVTVPIVNFPKGGLGVLERQDVGGRATWVCVLGGPILFDGGLFDYLEVRLFGHFEGIGVRQGGELVAVTQPDKAASPSPVGIDAVGTRKEAVFRRQAIDFANGPRSRNAAEEIGKSSRNTSGSSALFIRNQPHTTT